MRVEHKRTQHLANKSARFYDQMYHFKNYAAESQRLNGLIGQYKRAEGNQLLDIGCGSGQHLTHLQSNFTVTGLDLDEDLLTIAGQRLPEVTFHKANMIDFDLSHTYDIVISLFSAIGYVRTVENLNRTVATMAHHLKSGGVLLVEPWLYPQFYTPDLDYHYLIDEPDLKISVRGTLENNLSVLNYRYSVSAPEGTETFEEHHELGLFTAQQYQHAFEATGLETHNHMIGLDGRGLWIGTKP